MLGGWKDEGYVRATLDQVINSGKLSLIRSQFLQDNIAAHLEVLASSENAFQNLGNMNLDTMIAMNQRLSFSFDDSAWEITTPANELLADQDLERLVGHFGVVYTLMANGHRTTVQRNQAYVAALEAYVREREWVE
ncbi:MAG: hypothetical protein CMK09_17455 [Ponticaulis sp.]|nr:hypothetical protein [Ponticaulis sp.]|tara:strand:+ start:50376 stop:50783 length:408 start_codon:yes stop_codon:yes gene_type:complete